MAGDWQQHEVSKLIEAGTLLIGDGYRAKNDELGGHGLPFARAGNINDGFQFNNADRFPEANLGRVGNKISQPCDVVFTSKGTVGRFAFVRPDTPRFVYSPQLCFWRSVDGNVIEPRFLFYWMFGREFFVQFKGVAGQTDMAEYVSLTDQRRMHVTLPPPAEQRAIAHILGTLDDKIDLNRRMNETLEAMARALFKSWFVDFDPVHAKAEGRDPGLPKPLADLFPARLVDSELGEIPEGWEVARLRDLADVVKGLSYKGEGLADDGGLPMVNLGCFVGAGVFNAEKIKRYRGDYKDRHLVKPGDLVIANTDMTQNRVILGSPSLVPELDGEKRVLFTHHTFAVRFKPSLEQWRRYLYFSLLQPEFREIAEGFATGTTVLALPRDALLNLSLLLPSNPLLEAFERQIEQILASADIRRQQSRTLMAIRDALLPELIAGQLRVGDAQSVAEKA